MPKEQIIIMVRVQPNASKSEVTDFRDGVLKVSIAAPPVKGKANQELIKFLSALLGVSKSDLDIVRGATSKMKTVVVRGQGQNTAQAILEKYQTR